MLAWARIDADFWPDSALPTVLGTNLGATRHGELTLVPEVYEYVYLVDGQPLSPPIHLKPSQQQVVHHPVTKLLVYSA